MWETWLPLAGSWILMGLELPVVTAILARLADPKIHLAAYGSVVFAVALVVEAPIIMMLAASTALSKDWASYVLLRRFMMMAGAVLTLLHALIAFTPLYFFVVRDLIGAPADVLGPARFGLMITLPWTWAIAVRRFHQGVLIRFGHSRVIVRGTVARLLASWTVLAVGLALGSMPGTAVGAAAIACGVLAEATFIGYRVQPILRGRLQAEPPVDPPLTYGALLRFYVPLALTPMLGLLTLPIVSAALSRMPQPLTSLAVWPVMQGFTFLFRSVCLAFNEVVVSLVDRPGGYVSLRRFAWRLGLSATGILVLVAATPLADVWFRHVSGLPPELAKLAAGALWISVLTPGLAAALNWLQGIVVQSRQTRAITEAMALFLTTMAVLLTIGATWDRVSGLYVGLVAVVTGLSLQVSWLWIRSRKARRAWSAHS